MRVLLCHNRYQHSGGEDRVLRMRALCLKSMGMKYLFTMSNDAITGMNRLELVAKTFWNKAAASELGKIIRRERPQIMHCTNTFPLISPAAYRIAKGMVLALSSRFITMNVMPQSPVCSRQSGL